MKAKVKKEFVGHSHPVLGLLVADYVYEVETPGELFDSAEKKDTPKKSAPAAEKE